MPPEAGEYSPRAYLSREDFIRLFPHLKPDPLFKAGLFLAYEYHRREARLYGGPVFETHLLTAADISREAFERSHWLNRLANFLPAKLGVRRRLVLKRPTAWQVVGWLLHDALEGISAAEYERRHKEIEALGSLRGGKYVLPMVLAFAKPHEDDFPGRTQQERETARDQFYLRQLATGKILNTKTKEEEQLPYWDKIRTAVALGKGGDSGSNLNADLIPPAKRSRRLERSRHYASLFTRFPWLHAFHQTQMDRLDASPPRKPSELGRFWASYHQGGPPIMYRRKTEQLSGLTVLEGPSNSVILFPDALRAFPHAARSLESFLPENWVDVKRFPRVRMAGKEKRGNVEAIVVTPDKKTLGIMAKPVSAAEQEDAVKTVGRTARSAAVEAAALILSREFIRRQPNFDVERPLGVVVDHSTGKPSVFLITQAVKGVYRRKGVKKFNSIADSLRAHLGLAGPLSARNNVLHYGQKKTLVGFNKLSPISETTFHAMAQRNIPFYSDLINQIEALFATHSAVEVGTRTAPKGSWPPKYRQ